MSDDWSDEEMVPGSDALPGPGELVQTKTQESQWSDDDDEDGGWGDEDDDVPLQDDTNMFQQEIRQTPAKIKQLARRNAEELKILRLFRGDVQFTGALVHAFVGIDLSNISLITQEQKEVWGLTSEDKFLIVKISCGTYYLDEGVAPAVMCGVAPTVDPNVELKPFALSWTIKERTQNTLLSMWPPELDGESPPSIDELVELMGDFGLTYSECLKALQLNQYSQANAMMMLADESQKNGLRDKLRPVVECNRELSNMWDFDVEMKQFSSENKEYEEDGDATMPDSDTESAPKKRNFVSRLFGGGGGASSSSAAVEEEVGPKTLAARIFKARDGIRSLATMCRHNFLARVGWFALNVLMNGNKKCMICNADMPFVGLKPGVCQKRVCEFGLQELGLGFSLATEILLRPQITDLLISFVVAACHANRVDIFFPNGVIVDTPDGQESFCLPDQKTEEGNNKPDVNKLLSVANQIPSVDTMTPWATEGDVELKKKLTEIHPLMHGLLMWVITSNRTHLRLLKEGEIISQLDQATHQFALCSATPEREQVFQELKKKHGSFWTYHGSQIGNWHSILRMGLKNYSGTKRQQNGAAYGAGVYLAMNAQTSVGYSGRGGQVWTNTSYNPGFACMAVCEIIDHPDLKEQSAFGGIYVIQEEEYIVTRVLLLFNGSVQNVHSRSLNVPQYVRQQSE